MRLLLLAQFFPPDMGGEELHVFNLGNALADRGHEVAVATQHMDGVPDKEVLPSGVRVYRFRTMAMRLPGVYTTSRLHHPPVPDPLAVRALADIVRRERPQVIHAHNWIVNSALALRRRTAAGKEFGLVLTLHDFSHVCSTKRLMRKGAHCQGPAIRRCLPCATTHYGPVTGLVTATSTPAMRVWRNRGIDHVISVSTAVARGNGILGQPGSSVIPNFVPDAAVTPRDAPEADGSEDGYLPAMPAEPFLLFVGDLSRDKGVPTLLRAYQALGEGPPPLLLVGRRTRDTPSVVPAGAEMHFDWPHAHVMAAFRRCRLAVLPSVWPDPCPTTVLEAMASGSPVVSTSTGGIADMIVDGTSGLLVPPGDEHALTAAISRVLADEDLRFRLKAGGRERVRSFSASTVVERLEEVYVRVAPQRSTGAQPGGTVGLT